MQVNDLRQRANSASRDLYIQCGLVNRLLARRTVSIAVRWLLRTVSPRQRRVPTVGDAAGTLRHFAKVQPTRHAIAQKCGVQSLGGDSRAAARVHVEVRDVDRHPVPARTTAMVNAS